jgi:hypothetical protein
MDQANWIRARALMDERMREIAEGISKIEHRGQIHLFDVERVSTTDREDPAQYAHNICIKVVAGNYYCQGLILTIARPTEGMTFPLEPFAILAMDEAAFVDTVPLTYEAAQRGARGVYRVMTFQTIQEVLAEVTAYATYM